MTTWIRGRYESLEIVGRGGQGEVIRAIDHQHDRQVAMKIRRLSSETDRDGLLAEARVLLALRPHAGLPLVREDFFDGDRYCIVMDWIEGTSLAQLLEGHTDRLPLDDAISALWQVALALDHLHAHDPPIVHQDVKPGNIIRTPDGRIVLVDFGLSRAPGAPARRHAGTPGFAAPELATAELAGPAADVYALAATAFALLSGRPPGFDIDEWSTANPRSSDRILAVIRKGLSIDPGRRQQRATEFVWALARAAGRRVPPGGRVVVSRSVATALVAVGAVSTALVAVVVTSRGSASIDRPVTADSVAVFEPGAARLSRSFPLEAAPIAVVSSFGALWVLDGTSGRLLRVDPGAGTVSASIELGDGGTALAAGEGFVWVTNADGRTLLRIDPATNAVAPAIQVGNSPSGLAVGDGAVWVANRLDDSIARIDPITATVARTIPVGQGPVGVAIGHGSVWVTNATAGTLSRISATAGTVVDTINVGLDPEAVATSRDAVWVANRGDRSLSRIDPTTRRQTVVNLGFEPGSIAALGDAVWISDGADGRIVRIDPVSGGTVLTVTLGSPPNGVSLSDESLFVATGTATAMHRGGTLQVVTSSDAVGSLDPVRAFADGRDLIGQTGIFLTGDRLVWYRHAGGATGVSLVPDLAASLPPPTNGGRTYTVLLRPGIKFADGSPLTAADVKRSFERVYSSPAPLPGEDLLPLVGKESCTEARCDLSAGIQIDQSIGTVTFQLTRPDPEFLYRLGSPEFTIVPASTGPPRAGDQDVSPVAGTGPYAIDRVDRDSGEVDLVRNRFFKEWSSAARPDGYPDRIVIRGGIAAQTQADMIAKGDADVSLDDLSQELEQARKTSPAGVHDYTLAGTRWFFLNTTVAPFDDVRVRKALSLAVDRAKLAASDPGGLAALTCQILPPGFPAYRPSCPSATGEGTTSWRGPDLSSAQALVDASGTRGMNVEVWTSTVVDPPQVGAARSVVEVLNALGFQASLHEVDGDLDDYRAAILDRERRVQIGTLRWGADFLDPYDFFQLFTCDSEYNPGRFCDPKVDTMIAHAQDVQLTDQAAASSLWADVDRALAGEFPALPYANYSGSCLLGARVGDYQFQVKEGVLLDQLWVQ